MLFQAKPAVLDVVVCREANSRCPADEIPGKELLTMQIYDNLTPVSSQCSIQNFEPVNRTKDVCRYGTWKLENPIGPVTMKIKVASNFSCKVTVVLASEALMKCAMHWQTLLHMANSGSTAHQASYSVSVGTTDTEEKKKTDQQRIIKQQTNTDTREKHSTISQETMDSNSKKEFDEKTQTYKTGGSIEGGVGNLLSDTDIFSSAGAVEAMKEFGRGEFKKVVGWLDENTDGGLEKAKEWFSSDNKLNKLKDWMKVEDLADASKWLNGENVGNVMDKDKAGNYASRLSVTLVGTNVNKRASELINKANNYKADDSKPSGGGGAGGSNSEPAQAGGGGSGQSGGGGGGGSGGGGGLGNIKVGVKAKVEAGAEFTTKSGWQTESVKTVRKSESSGSRSMVSSSTMSELENTFTNSITTIRSTTRLVTFALDIFIPPKTTVGVEQLWIRCPHVSTETPNIRVYEGEGWEVGVENAELSQEQTDKASGVYSTASIITTEAPEETASASPVHPSILVLAFLAIGVLFG
uniref:Uncharacterized protein n=1 Tax=Ditylenchus dipsaci TaxID=166011 RepID=A0A915CMH8_9BILA